MAIAEPLKTGGQRGKLDALVLRPGPGWKHLGGVVWEHENKTRIHWSGPIVRLPDGSMPSVWADRSMVNFLIKINGGNRKRGIMAYAMTLFQQNVKGEPRCK